ncbi:DUF3159 domain-containing protein [Actinomyces sp. B33]|uniref:DUF3159 domain-containing protein n=1 Tax=Actinomyces sp. B33 TaxID=2942131 RepID=UPI00234125F0|nr:DUF3159 domain-containing protein [Actinomyces sp. B33]MDC4233190.1 DUF3159 domain-containing protein [Actinomyces sp. B33]
MSAPESPENASPGRAGAWTRVLDEDSFSWRDAVGGARGVVEAVAPGLVFVVAFVATSRLWPTLIASAAVALVACAVRLVQRQPLTQALSGLVGVGIGVAWAALSGRGENYFTWGLITATAFLAAILVSVLVGRSAASIGVGLAWELPDGWRSDPRMRPLVRRCTQVSLLWAAMFAIRLGIQLPLWWAGMVAELGIAKLVLGLPLFALACWATWAGLRPFAPAAGRPGR